MICHGGSGTTGCGVCWSCSWESALPAHRRINHSCSDGSSIRSTISHPANYPVPPSGVAEARSVSAPTQSILSRDKTSKLMSLAGSFQKPKHPQKRSLWDQQSHTRKAVHILCPVEPQCTVTSRPRISANLRSSRGTWTRNVYHTLQPSTTFHARQGPLREVIRPGLFPPKLLLRMRKLRQVFILRQPHMHRRYGAIHRLHCSISFQRMLEAKVEPTMRSYGPKNTAGPFLTDRELSV